MKGYRERLLEEQHSDLHQVIPPLVNAIGQYKAAKALKVSQSFISIWLKRNGYELKKFWVQTGESVQ